ncbi:hypothetical protein [Azospirillum sp. B506]|uniref:hypothetical protein n=1 Tax=Azospirillum sp. B506 TaxID=137721 RepID=UPI00034D5B97|nr:hypothetical protein [Azospirillum sp. B506]
MRKPHPTITTIWCPIPSDDTAYEIRGSYTGFGDAVEVFDVAILIDDRWQAPRNAVLDEILRKVLQPAAEEAAAKVARELREAMQMQAVEHDERWHDERKERQLERAHQRLAAE